MIKTDGVWFKDEHGRVLMLRGVNLAGSSNCAKRLTVWRLVQAVGKGISVR